MCVINSCGLLARWADFLIDFWWMRKSDWSFRVREESRAVLQIYYAEYLKWIAGVRREWLTLTTTLASNDQSILWCKAQPLTSSYTGIEGAGHNVFNLALLTFYQSVFSLQYFQFSNKIDKSLFQWMSHHMAWRQHTQSRDDKIEI